MLKEKNRFPLLKYLTLTHNKGMTIAIILVLLGMGKISDKLISIFSPPTPKIENPTLIVEKIRGVSELTTAVFVMETVIPASQESKLGGFIIGETKLIYVAHGEAKAVINLEKLTRDSVKVSDNRIQIQLPSPEILDSKIPLID